MQWKESIMEKNLYAKQRLCRNFMIEDDGNVVSYIDGEKKRIDALKVAWSIKVL